MWCLFFCTFCFGRQAASSVNMGLDYRSLSECTKCQQHQQRCQELFISMFEVVCCLYVVILNCVSVKLPVKFQSKR